MNQNILEQLMEITKEEKEILAGREDVCKKLYTSHKTFVIDSETLLEKGQLIEIRPHTRFVHFPNHRHNYVELTYMYNGQTTHILNDKETLCLEEGDLLFLSQNVWQEILPAGKEDIAVNFIILPEFFDRAISMVEEENVLRDFLIATLSSKNTEANYLHFKAKEILPVQNILESMIWTLLYKKYDTNVINQISMGLLILNLSQFAENMQQNSPIQYEQSVVFHVLKYIDTHYKKGTLAEVSRELGQETYYICRVLKKHTKSNFKELLQQRKMQQATYLLRQTHLPVEAIMEAVGYQNSSYFYRKFNEKYGCSPKNYRLP